MKYTGEMEKAMYQAHGIGYEEYSQKLSKRIEVERNREKEYEQSLKIASEIERRCHT